MPVTRTLLRAVIASGLAILPGCDPQGASSAPTTTEAPTAAAPRDDRPTPLDCESSHYAPEPAEQERDAIFTLLAMAIALKGWQSAPQRGHNIAAVLVDPSNRPVCWGRNANHQAKSRIAHAEARAIRSYLTQSPRSDLAGFTLYATLEPCAMCSGTMLVSGLKKVIYAQDGGRGGKTIEALNCYRARNGKPSLPLIKGRARLSLHNALEANRPPEGVSWRQWRYSDATRRVFETADSNLGKFQVAHAENAAVLEQARKFLGLVPAEYRALPYSEACSPPANDGR